MKKVTLYLLIPFSFLSSCSPVKMALNESQWPQKKEYAVTNKKPLFRQQKLAFGEFATEEVKRSWTKGTKESSGFALGGASISIEHLTRKQTFRFKLQNGAQTSETFCAHNLKAKDLVLGTAYSGFNTEPGLFSVGLESDNRFYAKITTNSGAPWELLLDNQAAQRSKTYAGSLMQSPENYYLLVPVNQLQGKNGQPVSLPFGIIGFEIRNKQNQPVAAVSLLDKGTVYLQEVPAEEKFLLANACAALLLQANDL